MLIGVAMATLISTIVGVILELYFLFRMVSRLTQESSEAYEIREWLGFATPNFLTAIVDTVSTVTVTVGETVLKLSPASSW